jgi:hypothetical protein
MILPQQLLAMIREIDKICPEEGMPNNPILDAYPQTPDIDNNTTHD